ncbi:MAG: hypothetical protein QOD00_2780 [Blastocatellia bacterium]|jgi:hypothetical protein|nr:hypothetical protein [Blastocatellia bacterium]
MKNLLNFAALFVVPWLLLVLIQGESCRSVKIADMDQKKANRLAGGVWGGKHVNLEVTNEGASVEFDCAHGMINQPIILDARGGFNVQGTYVAEGHGPTREGVEADATSARYKGSLSGDLMTLTVTLAESTKRSDTYTLTRGKQGNVMKCG